MKYITILALFLFIHINAKGQTNIICTNNIVEQVLMGNYNPIIYTPSVIINAPDSISQGILTRVSADSLKAFLYQLKTFRNRNTGSDTVSSTNGFGAARRWVYAKFQQFATANQNRLLPAYLQFDTMICSMLQHRNIMAVLPGLDTADKSIIIIEGHMDSRCSDVCDTACIAHGAEDNGSGTALVLELARVMSKYAYNHTIVFVVTTGEEQGLFGGYAMAKYAQQKGIGIKAVLNNDVIGGIICGHTSSAPGCPGYNNIDSTHVRLFSYGGFNSFNKGLCRYIKLEYKEMIQPHTTVTMGINMMTPEDRTGRGGDHIPFRQLNYTAMRFTAANEYGDANVTSGSYIDRQHTSSDSLGLDANNDGIIDSFYVNFNYLARNTIINGNAAAMAAISPKTPDFTLTASGASLQIQITQQQQYLNYRVGVRTTTYDWDSVYTFSGTTSCVISNLPAATYIVSVASVDANGVESLFSKELMGTSLNVIDKTLDNRNISLLQNKPNPSDIATMISVWVNNSATNKNAYILIKDITGREIKKMDITLTEGMNEIMYEHGYNMTGTYIYSLVVDGNVIDTKKMTFTN